MAADDENDAQTLLIATPVYASKSLNVDDLEFDQECAYTKLPGKYGKIALWYLHTKTVTNLLLLFTLLTNLSTSNSELSIVFRNTSMRCNLATLISSSTIWNFNAFDTFIQHPSVSSSCNCSHHLIIFPSLPGDVKDNEIAEAAKWLDPYALANRGIFASYLSVGFGLYFILTPLTFYMVRPYIACSEFTEFVEKSVSFQI
jgi:hypothetical protein